MSQVRLLTSDAEVLRALLTYTDWWQPSTSSLIQVGFANRGTRLSDGLREGLLDTLDERTELRRRVAMLPETDQLVLFLWYVPQLRVEEIARELRISPRHCHRVRARAVKRIVKIGRDEEEVA